jgi:hypothetical protein
MLGISQTPSMCLVGAVARVPLRYISTPWGSCGHGKTFERTWGCARNAPRCGRLGSGRNQRTRRSSALLAPYPAEEMTCRPESARVGNVRNNDPNLIEPIAGAAQALVPDWTAGR